MSHENGNQKPGSKHSGGRHSKLFFVESDSELAADY